MPMSTSSGMIPHHQAIAMAWGLSPTARMPRRGLAEGVIVAQEGEIVGVKRWLASRGQ
jgi:uncharacterized protein (DUF305 family)